MDRCLSSLGAGCLCSLGAGFARRYSASIVRGSALAATPGWPKRATLSTVSPGLPGSEVARKYSAGLVKRFTSPLKMVGRTGTTTLGKHAAGEYKDGCTEVGGELHLEAKGSNGLVLRSR